MRSSLLLIGLVAIVALVGAASAASVANGVSPAELSFSMAELGSEAQASAGAFAVDSPDFNENEADAASEGITDDEVFAQLDSEAHAANCTGAAPVAPAAPVVPPSTNPIVARVAGKAITKEEFQAAGHAVTMPKLLDPQPVNGIKIAGKMTPGFHCEHRVGCRACLRLTSCLWNTVSKKCAAVTAVGAMSRRDQWNHVATCDRSLPPSQQRVDRRDRGALRQANQHRRLDSRAFTPIIAVEVEADADSDADADADAHADSDADLDLDSDIDSDSDSDSDLDDAGSAEPADYDSEGRGLPVPATNKARFAQVDSDADSYAQTLAESELEAAAEQQVNAAFLQMDEELHAAMDEAHPTLAAVQGIATAIKHMSQLEKLKAQIEQLQ